MFSRTITITFQTIVIERHACANLNLVADVNDQCAGQGPHGDPPAGLPNLEAQDAVIGRQDGEAAGVGVGREAQRELGLGAFRVVAHPQACGADFFCASERPLQEVGAESEAYGEQPQQRPA